MWGTLSGYMCIVVQVATAVQADWLFLLTDVDALYTADPGTNPEAEPIREVHDIAQLQVTPASLKGLVLGTHCTILILTNPSFQTG